MNLEIETINRLLELGGTLASSPPVAADSDPFVIIPTGSKVEDMSKYYPPTTIKARVKLTDAASFVHYVNHFKTEGTTIFGDLAEETFIAILDYHIPDRPGYARHRACLKLERTPEFEDWLEHDRKKMNQEDFAIWLEDARVFFKVPDGATLLELITNLSGHTEARFNESTRLKDGTRHLTFDEDTVVKGALNSKGGEMELPEWVAASMSMFTNGTECRLDARLKIQVSSRKLLLSYETTNLPRTIRDSVLQVREQIRTATELPVLLADTNGETAS